MIAWTAIIQAHSSYGQARVALQLFQQMKEASVSPIEKTYAYVLSVIANLASMHEGQCIHNGLMVFLQS